MNIYYQLHHFMQSIWPYYIWPYIVEYQTYIKGIFRFQLQFATNRIKIGPLEPEKQPEKCALRHYAGPITSHDFIGLPPVTISLVTLDYCFFTVEDYTKDTQEISCGQLPHRRRERRMFVIYNSAHQLCFIANYLGNMIVSGYTTITSTFIYRFSRFKDQCECKKPRYSFSRAKIFENLSQNF